MVKVHLTDGVALVVFDSIGAVFLCYGNNSGK